MFIESNRKVEEENYTSDENKKSSIVKIIKIQ
jgi:hypothetical protein